MSSMHQRKRKHHEAPDALPSGSLHGTADDSEDLSPSRLAEQSREQTQTSSISSSRAGHAYRGAAARDNARAHFGDVIAETVINNYGHPSVSKPHDKTERAAALMKALRFDRMTSRLAGILPAQAKTCRWIFDKPEYLRWRDPSLHASHSGMFWIKGKAGVGKSTLMRVLLKHLEKTAKDCHVISFFFNARGGPLERSVEGMYRSLLHQILKMIPETHVAITSRQASKKEGQPWEIDVLRNLFYEAVMDLQDEHLICVIDALDECDQLDIRSMVDSMYGLAETAQSSFDICFASRHYPSITVKACEELVLERQAEHAEDMETYISSRLVVREDSLKVKLQSTLETKSNGVFLWIVLVIQELNRQYDDGATPSQLLNVLGEVPADLTDLLRSIIAGGASDDRLLPAMIWVLVARRGNIEPWELYDAIQWSTGQMAKHGLDVLKLDTESQHRFILSASKGLLEVKTSTEPFPLDSVQFVHETVREYLLQEGLAYLYPYMKTSPEGSSHAIVARWCQSYVRFISPRICDGQVTISNWSDPPVVGFGVYVTANLFFHMEAAYTLGDAHLDCLTDFPLSQWIHVRNSEHSYSSPDTEYLYRPLYSASASLLYFLLERKCERLAEAIIDNFARLRSEEPLKMPATHTVDRELVDCVIGEGLNIQCGGKYCIPLGAAAALGNVKIVRILLEQGADPNFEGRSDATVYTALAAAVLMDRKDVTTLLLDRGADINHRRTWEGQQWHTALHVIFQRSFVPTLINNKDGTLLRLLFDRGARAEVQELSKLLLAAARYLLLAQMKVLLENGADPNFRDLDGQSALHLLLDTHFWNVMQQYHTAEDRERKTAALALLAHGADVNAIGGMYGTALVAALHKGFFRTAKALIRHGADLHYRHEIYGTALETAKRQANEQMIRLLIEAHNRQHPMPAQRHTDRLQSFYVLWFSITFVFGYTSVILCFVGIRHLCLRQ